jgi:hypothetical protein
MVYWLWVASVHYNLRLHVYFRFFLRLRPARPSRLNSQSSLRWGAFEKMAHFLKVLRSATSCSGQRCLFRNEGHGHCQFRYPLSTPANSLIRARLRLVSRSDTAPCLTARRSRLFGPVQRQRVMVPDGFKLRERSHRLTATSRIHRLPALKFCGEVIPSVRPWA